MSPDGHPQKMEAICGGITEKSHYHTDISLKGFSSECPNSTCEKELNGIVFTKQRFSTKAERVCEYLCTYVLPENQHGGTTLSASDALVYFYWQLLPPR